MSNPFDQFGAEFQAALPQVPPSAYPAPMGAQFANNPPQTQYPGYPASSVPTQDVYQQNYASGSLPYQQPSYAPYDQSNIVPSTATMNPYEQMASAPNPYSNYSSNVMEAPTPIASLGENHGSSGLGFTNNVTGDMGSSGISAQSLPYSQPFSMPYSSDLNPVSLSNVQPVTNPVMDPWMGTSNQPPPQPSNNESFGMMPHQFGSTPQPDFSTPGVQAQPPDSFYGGASVGQYDVQTPKPESSYGIYQGPSLGVPDAPSVQTYGNPFAAGDISSGALVPSIQQSNPYALPNQTHPDPNSGLFSQQANPYAQQPVQSPFPTTDSLQQANPYAHQPVQAPFPTTDSLQQQQGYGMPPLQDPYGQNPSYNQSHGQYPQTPYQAPPQQFQQPPPQYQQPPPPPADPFSVFESQALTVIAPSALVAQPPPVASDDDFWGSFGPNNPEPVAKDVSTIAEVPENKRETEDEKKGDEGLPPGGEFYDARIFTPTLGVMFFKPQELTDSLFLNTDRDVVDALLDRPVVAFIVEGSSARAAGVELGHVLLKVNGVDVKSPKEASRLIKEGPRPLPLLFYVPNTEVVTAEGEHMVKYDTKETTAPNSAKDWKPKYVVIGGIISQPWMMNMYRSKSEYDIAVIETQARRPVSVKVKQFSLQGSRIQNDWQGPQMVKYKNKLHPWKFIVVLPVARNPIKISSPNLSQLKPVHEGIRRVLLAQQRDRGGNSQRQSGPSRSSDSQGRAYNGVSSPNERERDYIPQTATASSRY